MEKANAVLAVRSLVVKQRQNKCNRSNLMTGKLYCERCGRLYHRKMSRINEAQRTAHGPVPENEHGTTPWLSRNEGTLLSF